MDIHCRIELFGALRVVQGDEIHSRFRTHKAAALLAYLALHANRSHGREHLIALFWPDMETGAGRDNLSAALSQLRRQLEPAGASKGSVLVADWRQVRLNHDVVTTDVADFDRALALARRPDAEDAERKIALLAQATDLYRGDLLPGFYDEWAISEQNRFQTAYRESLARLALLLENAERYTDALVVAQRATASDPLDERGYQTQMRLQMRLGQTGAATETFEQAKKVFRRELNAPPPVVLQQMADAIGKNAPAATPPLVGHDKKNVLPPPKPAKTPPLAAPPAPVGSATVPPPAALPLTLTRFFGRKCEQKQIQDLLQTPDVRLVTILGPGGAGKTRLSIEIARQAPPRFDGRVWFVSLADLSDPRLVASALASALRLPPDASSDPLEQVAARLGNDSCLLVLDNLEQLLREETSGGNEPASETVADLVGELLARAPGVRCLATSRQALQLGGEQIISLPPLTPPPPPQTTVNNDGSVGSPTYCLEDLARCESVALYVDRARAVRADFALTPANAASVAGICRDLEGMPLALEMAATWIKTLPPHKMRERLTRQLDLPVSRRRDLPARHQSLRAVIEWSYDLLPGAVRDTWARLSVFRGGWTLSAAEAVCAASGEAPFLAPMDGGFETLHALAVLQEHSLIVATGVDDNEPRYQMLESLRAFAAEKWAQFDPDTIAASRRAHAAFYANLTVRDKAADESEWYQAMEADHDNLRAAFDWFREDAASAEACLEFANRMQNFWLVRGYFREGRERLDAALSRPGAQAPTAPRARALNRVAALACRQGDYDTATACHEESFAIHSSMKNERGAAHALVGLGSVALMRRALGEAWSHHCKAMTLYRAQNDHIGLSDVLNNLGAIANQKGETEEALGLYEESLDLRRRFGDEQSVANVLSNLGALLCETGRMEKAESYLTECLRLCRALGNRRDGIYALRAWATMENERGEGERAARIYGATETLRDNLGAARSPAGQIAHQTLMDELRKQLGDRLFDLSWRAGRALSWERAVRYALREEEPGDE